MFVTFDQSESQRRQQRGIPTPDLPGETINPLDLIDQQIGIRTTGAAREAEAFRIRSARRTGKPWRCGIRN